MRLRAGSQNFVGSIEERTFNIRSQKEGGANWLQAVRSAGRGNILLLFDGADFFVCAILRQFASVKPN